MAKTEGTKSAKESTDKVSGLSQERVVDSESEGGEAPAAKPIVDKKPVTEKQEKDQVTNGVKRKAESVSSLDVGESSDDESRDEDAKPDAKRVKTALNDAGAVEHDSDSGSSADTAPAPRPARHANLSSIPAQPFKPPNGYAEVGDVTNVTFSADSFTAQQIWHIVAPTNVSLKSLGDMALHAIPSATTVLTHKGTEYSLAEDTSTNNQLFTVAVPSPAGYNVVQQPIIRMLYVKQKVTLPQLSKKQADVNTGSSAAADLAQPSVSEIRPQPKGMKMRYKPAGFGSGDPGLGSDSDEDGTQAKSTGSKFQFSKAIGAHGVPVEAENAQAKKTKKKRKDEHVEMVNGSIPDAKGEVSKEERKKLKAEKKSRKEAKAVKVL